MFAAFRSQAQADPATNPAFLAGKIDSVVVFAGSHQRLSAGLKISHTLQLPVFISSYRAVESLSEILDAGQMRAVLASRLVTLDEQALTTRENAWNARSWLKENSFSKPALITDRFHMPRALWEFRQANKGIDPLPVATANKPTGEINRKVIVLEPAKYLVARFGPRWLSGIRLPEPL